ncbi:competence protein CoiA family protein [Nostoc sp. CALU 1950]|uniref:competence protein CoiA family protein n=1 Tax=Nostoc sp. CALU 1950 TaxID=3104321 RepID=UPI003EBC2DFD
MKFAISMYEGGQEIYPVECDFFSYSERGLLCPECEQEVYLRKGNIRKPYFAHLHTSNSRQVKQCSLRVSSDENVIETNDFIENRGQRLKIFHEHFLSKFYIGEEKIIDDVKFKYWIKSIKNENNQALNSITEDCIEYFIKHRQLMEDKYVLPTDKIKDNQTILQQQIGLQVISYLCANAKFNFNLPYLLYYTIYQLYKPEKYKLFQQNFTIEDINTICQYTVKIIILNPWLKASNNTKNINSVTTNISQSFEPKIVKMLDIQDAIKGKSTKNINSLTINASQLSGSERTTLRTPLPLNYSFNAIKYGTVDKVTKVKTEKAISVRCKVVTETNTDDGNTAIQFSFMVNEYIKADNRMGIKNLDGKPVRSLVEIWHNARVYKFSKKFELSVINYIDGLFPSDGYLADYPEYRTRADVARLFESMISNGNFEFVKTLEHNRKLVITSCYDPSVFLLLELLEHCNPINSVKSTDKGLSIESIKFSNIDEQTILDCFINAASKASEQIPLIDGMLLTTLKQFATTQKTQLKELNETLNTELETSNKNVVKVENGRKLVDKFSSGLIDGWSMPFKVELQSTDCIPVTKDGVTKPFPLLTDTNKEMYLQCELQGDRVTLYRLAKQYVRSFSMDDETGTQFAHIKQLSGKKKMSLNMTQDRIKLVELGIVTISHYDCYEWIAVHPKYEAIANYLTKKDVLPHVTEFNGLTRHTDTVTIGDRIICNRRHIGKRPMIKTSLNKLFRDAKGVLTEYIWLESILKLAGKKMLDNNALGISEKLNDRNLSEYEQEKLASAKHNLKTLLRTIEHCIKPFVASVDIAQIRELNHCIASYMMCSLKLSRYDIIATCKALNQDSYNQLVAKARQYYDSKDGGFNETKIDNQVFYR